MGSVEFDPAAQCAGDQPADGQAQSHALRERVEFDETVEDAPGFCGRDAGAPVRDREGDPLFVRDQGVGERDPAVGGEACGVAQQFGQGLGEQQAGGVCLLYTSPSPRDLT